MSAHRTAALALAVVLAIAAGAAAGAHGEHAADHAQHDDHPDEAQDAEAANESEDAGPPAQAHFGLCKAYSHVPDHVLSIGPFAALSGSLCEDVGHPADEHGGAPDGAGPPS